jgi:hypothetical protein
MRCALSLPTVPPARHVGYGNAVQSPLQVMRHSLDVVPWVYSMLLTHASFFGEHTPGLRSAQGRQRNCEPEIAAWEGRATACATNSSMAPKFIILLSPSAQSHVMSCAYYQRQDKVHQLQELGLSDPYTVSPTPIPTLI